MFAFNVTPSTTIPVVKKKELKGSWKRQWKAKSSQRRATQNNEATKTAFETTNNTTRNEEMSIEATEAKESEKREDGKEMQRKRKREAQAMPNTNRKGRDSIPRPPHDLNGREDTKVEETEQDEPQKKKLTKEEEYLQRHSQIHSSLFTSLPKIPQIIQPTKAQPNEEHEDIETEEEDTIWKLVKKYLPHIKTHRTPTQIQRLAITQIIKNQHKDFKLQSQTGSGKTIAYLLPALVNIARQVAKEGETLPSREMGTRMLILAPTRELALQIESVFLTIAAGLPRWMVSTVLVGGANRHAEKARLRKGCPILIATPGRILDHLENTKAFTLRNTNMLILDEADRFDEAGFSEAVQTIYKKLPPHQTLLVSATLPNVHKLGIELKDPQLIALQTVAAPPVQLKMEEIITPTKLKLPVLLALLAEKADTATIVFVPTKDGVMFTAGLLTELKYKVVLLHGDLPQKERSEAVKEYIKSGGILVTTDVASRGLDLPVARVIQTAVPTNEDEFLHRVGRTARAGMAGSASLILGVEEVEWKGYGHRLSYEEFLLRTQGRGWQRNCEMMQSQAEKWVVESQEVIHSASSQSNSSIDVNVESDTSSERIQQLHTILQHISI